MNLQLLIDSIVHQTTVLIAQLATAQGVRAPLAHVADQVFLELADELRRQGISRKVSANMFGLALRTYLRRIQRLGESATVRGCSLSDAVLGYLRERRQAGAQIVPRSQVLQHFFRDEAELVRSVLHDLCESGLALRTGRGDAAGYRAASEEEMGELSARAPNDELLWALIYRGGPVAAAEFERLGNPEPVRAALERLLSSGRIAAVEGSGDVRYVAHTFFVPRGASEGWEGAIFDHFQAMVRTIAARLSADAPGGEESGGSTYTFDVWPGHPLQERVLAQLREFRDRAGALRKAVSEHNQSHPRPERYASVTTYVGQSLVEQVRDEPASDESTDDESAAEAPPAAAGNRPPGEARDL